MRKEKRMEARDVVYVARVTGDFSANICRRTGARACVFPKGTGRRRL